MTYELCKLLTTNLPTVSIYQVDLSANLFQANPEHVHQHYSFHYEALFEQQLE